MDKLKFENHRNQLSPQCTGEMDYLHWANLKDICDKSNPKSILELGFNRGISALMWLEGSEASLHSIDIRDESDIKESLDYINNQFPDRFTYTKMDHKDIDIEAYKNKYDLIFIDGDHSYHAILRDAKNAISLNAEWIAFDDYFHRSHGNDTKRVIEECGLEIIKEYEGTVGQVLTKNVNRSES